MSQFLIPYMDVECHELDSQCIFLNSNAKHSIEEDENAKEHHSKDEIWNFKSHSSEPSSVDNRNQTNSQISTQRDTNENEEHTSTIGSSIREDLVGIKTNAHHNDNHGSFVAMQAEAKMNGFPNNFNRNSSNFNDDQYWNHLFSNESPIASNLLKRNETTLKLFRPTDKEDNSKTRTTAGIMNNFKVPNVPFIKISNISHGVYKAECSQIVRSRDYSFQAAIPLQPSSFVSYYEVKILSLSPDSRFSFGLAPANFPTCFEPGRSEGSIGYHSEIGNILLGQRKVIELNKKFGVGDEVGCGVRWCQNGDGAIDKDNPLEAFFTKNGTIIYDGIKRNFDNIFPTIALNKAAVHISFNPKKFVFSKELVQMEQLELMKAKMRIESIKIEERTIRSIIREYLIHEGFVDTLDAFDKSSFYDSNDDSNIFSDEVKVKLAIRNNICNLIISGKIKEAMTVISQLDPTFFEKNRSIELLLYYQLFIEYIKEKNITDALSLLRQKISKFFPQGNIDADSTWSVAGAQNNDIPIPTICQLTGLIAYAEPEASPLKGLLQLDRRYIISDLVKRQLKASLGLSKNEMDDSSVIENILKQLLLTFSKAFHPNTEKEKSVNQSRSLFDFLGI